MKLKYYLRGLGIGIIITTIILTVSFSKREVHISDEEVMARAAQLGMVMPKDETTESEENTQIIETETQTAEPEQNTQVIETETQTAEGEPPVADTETGTYRLTIQKGDVCRVVCENLAASGVIEDAEALRKYLFEIGYASNMSTGEYDIPYGLTLEEVANVLRAGPIEE